MRRIDLHLHTSGSFDCHSEPEAVFRRCLRLGLEPVFVTDHDSIEEALRLRSSHPGQVIVGQEVTTETGEVIGLYLEEPIPAGLSADEAVERIKGQGGLVYLEHPFDSLRRPLDARSIQDLVGSFDIVEVHNSRSSDDANLKAAGLRRTLGVPGGAGSDAHHIGEIGSVYVELPDFGSPSELIRSLEVGRVISSPNRAAMAARRLLMATIGRR